MMRDALNRILRSGAVLGVVVLLVLTAGATFLAGIVVSLSRTIGPAAALFAVAGALALLAVGILLVFQRQVRGDQTRAARRSGGSDLLTAGLLTVLPRLLTLRSGAALVAAVLVFVALTPGADEEPDKGD